MSLIISTLVNNVPVQGTVTHLKKYDLTIEITQPFSGFTAGCHIPYFARNHMNYTGRYDKAKTIELLTGLYKDLMIINSERQTLHKGLQNLYAEIEPVQAEQRTLKKSRLLLRNQFANGGISQTTYQSRLKQLRNRCFALETKIESIKTAFMEKHLSRCRGFVGIERPKPPRRINIYEKLTFQSGAFRYDVSKNINPVIPSPVGEVTRKVFNVGAGYWEPDRE